MWSWIKKAAKAVWRVVKTVVRWAVKIVATAFGIGVNILDLIFGFLNWPPKKLTLHINILSQVSFDMTLVPICQDNDPALLASIDQAERILRERFNVKLRPYASQYAQILNEVAPDAALNPSCCGADHAGQEFLEQGEWYAGRTAGWVGGIPISLQFPITAFVVADVDCKNGCSLGPLTDYIVVDMDGVKELGARLNNSLLVHEIGHACNLNPAHWWVGVRNIMWAGSDRGDEVKWWQRNILRSSRHVTYW